MFGMREPSHAGELESRELMLDAGLLGACANERSDTNKIKIPMPINDYSLLFLGGVHPKFQNLGGLFWPFQSQMGSFFPKLP